MRVAIKIFQTHQILQSLHRLQWKAAVLHLQEMRQDLITFHNHFFVALHEHLGLTELLFWNQNHFQGIGGDTNYRKLFFIVLYFIVFFHLRIFKIHVF